MRDRKILINFFVLTVFLISAFFLINTNQKISSVYIAGQNIKVELALTAKEKNNGLSGRDSLAQDSGMLFVFEKAGRYSFWMKDMNFPIDIIWLGEDLKVVHIKKNATPESYPESFGPAQNARYVLEVVAGFSDKNNLKVGDGVIFTYQ